MNTKNRNVNGIIFTTRFAPLQRTNIQVSNKNSTNNDNIIDKINKDLSELYREPSNQYNQSSQPSQTNQPNQKNGNRFKIEPINLSTKKPNNYENHYDDHYDDTNNNHNNKHIKNEHWDIRKIGTQIDNINNEIECNKEKIYSANKRIHYMRKAIHGIQNDIDELKTKNNDHLTHTDCSAGSQHHNAKYNLKKHNIEIKNLSFCDKIMTSSCGNIIDVCGSFKLDNLNIINSTGNIYIKNLDFDLNNCVVTGYIKIYNTTNNIIYDGIIFNDNKIKYIISNRPVIPIGINMDAILLINYKIIKSKYNL